MKGIGEMGHWGIEASWELKIQGFPQTRIITTLTL